MASKEPKRIHVELENCFVSELSIKLNVDTGKAEV
jgi:hypothetical protein